MKAKKSIGKMKLRWLMAFMLISACVERIDFDVPQAQLQTVVEGMISDDPGPYTVKVSKGLSLDADSSFRAPIQNVKIKLFDDEGGSEDFSETSPGEYITGGAIQGQIGHAYYIRLEMPDGKIFESEPERINPVGEVEDIRFEFEARTLYEDYGEIAANVFNIYVDGDAGSGTENYVRWRFKGTYKIDTSPELHMTENPPYTPYKNPFPCSGYILVGSAFGGGGTLQRETDCTCCTCWVNQFESEPQLSDTQLISGNQFRNVKVAEVLINNFTFYDKYLVEIEQMSLSKKTFEFFKLIRAQKEGTSSLFQPPSGEIKGNVKPVNANESVIGIFWATSIKKESVFINRSDVPYLVTPIDLLTLPCNSYPNSSTDKPALWDE